MSVTSERLFPANLLVWYWRNWTTHTHARLTALFPGLLGWAGTRKVKPIWILLKQETVSGSGISWATCKSASRSRQITMPVPHHSKVFYRPDALPCRPTNSVKALKAMQKGTVFWIFREQWGQAGVENGAMLTTYSDILYNAPFRGQIFKIFFASGGKGALTPLTKILRTILPATSCRSHVKWR